MDLQAENTENDNKWEGGASRRRSLLVFHHHSNECKEDNYAESDIDRHSDNSTIQKSNHTSLSKNCGINANILLPISGGDIGEDDNNIYHYRPLWKFTNNPSILRYAWLKRLRTMIMEDLKRHFGREVHHARLLSCLGMLVINNYSPY